MPRKSLPSVGEDILVALKKRGVDSGLLDARLEFTEPDKLVSYALKPLSGRERIYPNMLPTQASGRWSTTEPPLVNYPPDCLNPDHANQPVHMCITDECFSAREGVYPDEGTQWWCWDYDAIEARIIAALANDEEDLGAFDGRWCTDCRHNHFGYKVVGWTPGGRGEFLCDKENSTNFSIGDDRRRRSDEGGGIDGIKGSQYENIEIGEKNLQSFNEKLQSNGLVYDALSIYGKEKKDPDTTHAFTMETNTKQLKESLETCNECGCQNKNLVTLDIHTLTACRMFDLPLPPVLDKSLHTSHEGAPWRAQVQWGGGEDRRRHLAKTCRYGLGYGSNEYALANAKDIEKLGISLDELYQFGRMYLASKPALNRAKRAAWDEVAKTGESRTFLGLRRKLYMHGDEYTKYYQQGKPCHSQLAGWSHRVSGAVSGIMNVTLAKIKQRWPHCWLILNKHDGAQISFPNGDTPIFSEFKDTVEKSWEIEGKMIKLKADHEIYYDNMTKGKR